MRERRRQFFSRPQLRDENWFSFAIISPLPSVDRLRIGECSTRVTFFLRNYTVQYAGVAVEAATPQVFATAGRAPFRGRRFLSGLVFCKCTLWGVRSVVMFYKAFLTCSTAIELILQLYCAAQLVAGTSNKKQNIATERMPQSV